MRSSGEENSNNNRGVSSSSSWSSSKSSSSPFSPTSLLPSQTRRTMEDVWKDISLNSLTDKPDREQSQGPKNSFRGMIFQDFLGGGRAFKEPPSNLVNHVSSLFGPPQPPPQQQHPATSLRLNSGEEFQYLDPLPYQHKNSHQQQLQMQIPHDFPIPGAATTSFLSFDALGSSPGLPSFSRKRLRESEDKSGDRRHKRMIKNRESAARSRARKQAYTNELELEVAHLMEENAKLRKQPQQLSASASASAPTKPTLFRTSTAPF